MMPGKYRKGKIAGNRAKRLGCLRRCLDIGHIVSVQRRGGRQHDEESYYVGETHSHKGVDCMRASCLGACRGALIKGLAPASSFSSSTSSDACQKNR
jgi:hypothetical protein